MNTRQLLSLEVAPAIRMMRRSPAVPLAVVAILALGIGANTAIFAVVNSLLLRPLPVAEPDRLATIASESAIARGFTSGFGWTRAMWDALQPHLPLFDGALAWTPATFDLTTTGERQLVDGIVVSAGFFETLGVGAIRGRTFNANDQRRGVDAPVAVISYRFWQRRFGGSEQTIGARLSLDGVSVTIIGVTPEDFSGLDVGRAFDVALPLDAAPRPAARRPQPLVVVLRLKPGQSSEAGTALLRARQPQLLGVSREALSRVNPSHLREPFTLASAATGSSLPVRGPEGLRQTYARPLLILLAVALLVLLIACVNIASLLLARVTARRHEIGVRIALGASRRRVAQQFLVEAALLVLPGVLGGLLIAWWSSPAMVAQLSTPSLPIVLDLSFDWRVGLFALGVAVATAVVFGTLPALGSSRLAPMDVLKLQGGLAHGVQSGRSPTLSGLAVLQLALSVTLVIAAALLVGSFTRVLRVPLGFDPERILVVNVEASRARTGAAGRSELYQRIVEAVGQLPGVADAGGAVWTPVDGGMRLGDPEYRIAFNFVTPGWFGAYGIPIRAGRDFTAADSSAAPLVAIVNQSYVRKHLAGVAAVGETIPHPRSRTAETRRTIVGIVEDSVFDSPREGVQAIVYLPVAQTSANGSGLADIGIGVRTVSGPPMQLARSIDAALRGVDPALSFSFRPLSDHVRASVRQERVLALLSGAFGALALVIAALGLYGVTSYGVNRRVAEIGIRRALGAQGGRVLWLVLAQTLPLTGSGIVLGLVAAAAVTRSLRALLFGLTPLDPATFAGVAAVFAVVSTAAALIPGYRATKIDPIAALRAERL